MDTSAFIQRFESATADLGNARVSLSEELRDFAAESTDWDLPATLLPSLQASIDDQFLPLDASQRAALETLRTRVEQTHLQFDSAVIELLEATQARVGDFDQELNGATEQLNSERERFTASVDEFRAAASVELAALTSAAIETAASLTQSEEALTALVGELTTEIMPKLVTAIDDFAGAVEGVMTNAIEAQFSTSTEHVNERFQAAASEVAQAFSGALEQLDTTADALKAHIAESLKRNLEEGADQLVDGATRKMTEEIIEGVITSQTGVAVTSAMSPYLPALIVIKRTTDVIKHGLELLKKVTTLGMG